MTTIKINHKFNLGLVAVAVSAYGIHLAMKPPFVNPHLKVPAYTSPLGCPYHPYDYGAGKLPCSCAAEKYKFPDASKYGFLYLGRQDNEYYRIGNDAVEISKLDDDDCWYDHVEFGIFHQ